MVEAHVPSFIFDEFRTILWAPGQGHQTEDAVFVCTVLFFLYISLDLVAKVFVVEATIILL